MGFVPALDILFYSGLFLCCMTFFLLLCTIFSFVSSEHLIFTSLTTSESTLTLFKHLDVTLKLEPLQAAACTQKSIKMRNVISTCIVVH